MAAVQLRSGELVVDLGAGTGNLSVPLAEAGARVIAVELHPRRAEELRRQLREYDVVVVERDLSTFVPPSRPFRVVANPCSPRPPHFCRCSATPGNSAAPIWCCSAG